MTWLQRWWDALSGLHRHTCRCGSFYLCSRTMNCADDTCVPCNLKVLAAWGLEYERRRKLKQLVEEGYIRGEL